MKLDLVNPATGETFHSLPCHDAAAITQAYETAVAHQPAWAATPYLTRAGAITKFRDLLAQEARTCAELLSCEMGKPVAQAEGEIKATLGRIDWFLEYTPGCLQTERVRVDTKGGAKMIEEISYEPLGVISNISAWNFPYFVGTNVIVPALLTGNAVLYKPSELTSMTGIKIAELLHKAGVPTTIFQTIVGTGEAGAQVSRLPTAGLFFTGSVATGQRIAAETAKRFGRTTLELGGKDPAYVAADAHPERAAESLVDGSFYNAGQSCCAVERIYVHARVYDAFLEHFARFTRELRIGDPKAEGTYLGPVARQAQLAFLDGQVEDAVSKGARLLVKGGRQPGKGYFWAPTVLVDVDHTMSVMREESFGPIIGIQKVEDDATAIALMNETNYGLTAGVYTTSEERATTILRQMNSGTVYWNCCDRVSPYLPWTGRRNSGQGSTLSHLGIKAFVQPKAWHMRHP